MALEYNYKLIIAYDGTRYCGWQIQPNGLSIQQAIQEALSKILRKDISLIGSGRTDAGVHALGQIANFKFCENIDTRKLQHSLNSLLPPDIRVREACEINLNFHAQYSAKSKIYHYHLHLDRVLNPFNRLYSLHVKEKIDITLLKEASQYFLGVHDFASFANEAHRGVASYDSIRNLFRLDVVEQEGGVRLEFLGDGFLYKMVRNIVGTLLEVSTGKRKPEEIKLIFEAKNRKAAGKSAPPQGLFLVKVNYEQLSIE